MSKMIVPARPARKLRVSSDLTGQIRLLRRAGLAVLCLQLIAFLIWSAVLYSRFSETTDFAVYHQAWYLIAHGDLYPYVTTWGQIFARGDSEYLIWLLAPIYWIWPHDVVQLWLQDIFIVWAEAMAFTWICELVSNINRKREALCLAIAGLLLFIANPWIWWSVSFDFHMEAIAAPFLVLLARDLTNRRRRAWIWALLTMASGAQCAVYVAGLGLGAILSKRARLSGLLMAGVSIGYTALISILHVNSGVSIETYYGYLANGVTYNPRTTVLPSLLQIVKGVVAHPLRIPTVLWTKRIDVLANLMPAGLVGIIGDLAISPLLAVAVLEATLVPGRAFSEPLFQSLPIYMLLPVSTIAVLCWLARRRRQIALMLAGLIVAQCIGWAIVWAPRTSFQWLRVSEPAASTLSAIRAQIPSDSEVIASDGVVGDFSDRKYVYHISMRAPFPVKRRDVWFVITPRQGIETLSTAGSMELMGKLATTLHAKLIAHKNGVWAFRWRPPAGVTSVASPDGSPLQGWESPGVAGKAVIRGPARKWFAGANGKSGYVVDGLCWQVFSGWYLASVTMSSSGPADVEVWNDTPRREVLLARLVIPATRGIEPVSLPVDATRSYWTPSYSGWGPFRALFFPPPPGQRLEVRIWSPGDEQVDVYKANLIYTGGTHLRGT